VISSHVIALNTYGGWTEFIRPF